MDMDMEPYPRLLLYSITALPPEVRPLLCAAAEWVAGHSQWRSVQLLGGGGGGGESVLNLILVRMLLVEETKP